MGRVHFGRDGFELKYMCAASLMDESPERITTTGGDAPLWNHDGTELFYRDGEGWVTACRIRTTGSTVETGARERLFRPSLANSWGATYQHDIDANGRFFVFRVGDDAGSFANSLTVMQNWTKVLRK